MSIKYTYSIVNDFPNQVVTSTILAEEIQTSTITHALDYINTSGDDCDIWFKDVLTSGEETTLSGIIAAHVDGTPPEAPKMADGRPIVRSDSRPMGYYTMFTMVGDTASGIGDGKAIVWDFSNDDDLTASGIAPEGYKMKRIKISFADSVYIKEGCLYFFNAKKGSYINFSVICPAGHYYYKRNKTPAQAMEDTCVVRYVNKHHIYGDCPMGDELNTESATENPIPSNYQVWVCITVPESDNDSYGYGELETYRERTCLLPGEEI